MIHCKTSGATNAMRYRAIFYRDNKNRKRLEVERHAQVPFHVRHIYEMVNQPILQQLVLPKARVLTDGANWSQISIIQRG